MTREPGIFLFDEPLSNLDAELRVQMRVELSALHKRLKATMIYVTHDQTEAMTMADRIVVLRGGRVEQAGSPLHLYNHPANRFVAGFIGSPRMNFLEAVAHAGSAITVDDMPPVSLPAAAETSDGEAVTLGVRPEHLGFVADGGLPGTVDIVEQMGGESYVYVTLANGARLTVRNPGQTPLQSGEPVRVGITGAAHLFSRAEGESAIAARRPA